VLISQQTDCVNTHDIVHCLFDLGNHTSLNSNIALMHERNHSPLQRVSNDFFQLRRLNQSTVVLSTILNINTSTSSVANEVSLPCRPATFRNARLLSILILVIAPTFGLAWLAIVTDIFRHIRYPVSKMTVNTYWICNMFEKEPVLPITQKHHKKCNRNFKNQHVQASSNRQPELS
jgi:hypothetical protein